MKKTKNKINNVLSSVVPITVIVLLSIVIAPLHLNDADVSSWYAPSL